MRRVLSLLCAGALSGIGLLTPTAAQAAPGDLIPDEGFRACVQAALKDAPMTEESLATVTELKCVSGAEVTQVKALTGINLLTGLTSLLVKGHPLSDVAPVADAPALVEIELDSTGVSDLSVLSGSSTLKRLAVASSPVTSVAALSQMSLDVLALHNTKLTDLTPVAANPLAASLKELYLTRTGVRDMRPITGGTFPQVETLWMGFTPLTHLGAPGPNSFPKLKSVLIRNAGLTSVDFIDEGPEHMHEITSIDLAGNELTQYPILRVYFKLEHVNLADNNISTYDFIDIAGIKSLNMAGNRILDASMLQKAKIEEVDFSRQRHTISNKGLMAKLPRVVGPNGDVLVPKGCRAPVSERCQLYYDEDNNWELETLRDGIYEVHYQAAPVFGVVVEINSKLGRKFVDVPESHSFFAAIEWLADSEVTGGYGDRTFRPKASVTRGQMAAFLRRRAKAADFTAPKVSPFSDVSTSHPFYRDITWLQESGITGGFSDGTFKPGAKVTRGQMAAFLYRAEGQPDFELPETSPFTDVGRNGGFFRPVMWLVNAKVTGGYANGRFGVSDAITRGQFAAFLYRLDGQ